MPFFSEGGLHTFIIRKRQASVNEFANFYLYFTNFEACRKALTPKRLELLHLIKIKRPCSINELARMAKRNVKNIAEDVKYLEQIGLIEKKESLAKMALVITYDKLLLEIAV